MFYAQNLISRKGPLGNIWIAAFCFRKLKKEQIQGTDILSSIDTIMPEIQMPYRVLAQLLVGIVKIFSKKVDYLYHDCNEALDMIRRSITLLQNYLPRETSHPGRYYPSKANRRTRARAHKPSAVRECISVQPEELMRASHDQQTITVPERFELDSFDLQIPDAGDIAENSTDLTDLLLIAYKPLAVREATPMQPAELIRASHDQPAIIIPERFDLDSFDLQMSDEGGIAGNSTHLVLEDDWDDERSIYKGKETPCSPERCQREVTAGSEIDLPCFTPIDDAILSHAASIGFENTKALNSGCVATRREIFGSKFENFDKSVDQEVLSSETLVGPKMNGGSVEVQLVPMDLAGNVPLEFHSTLAEGPTRQPCRVNLKLPELITEKHPEVVTPREHASPDFMVTTPAKKEQRHMSRKRKNFDSSIVVSNVTMRLGIHDASNLVCKRRKAPHTCLDAWKAYKITNLRQTFFDPLIPCASLDITTLFHKVSYDHSAFEKAEDFLDQQVTTATHGNFNDSPKEMITISHTPQPSASDTAIANAAMPESGTEEPSVKEIMDSGSELELDRELFSNEKNTETEHSWSTRTRAVAKYICKRYRDLQEREGKYVLSLALLLEGQRRAKCARFFNETLSLKNSGCIDVDQQSPYGDIVILPSPKLEVLIKDG